MTSLSKLRPTGFRIKFKDGALVEYDVVHDGNCGYEVVGEELLRHGIIQSTTRKGAIIEVKKLVAEAWMQCGRVVYPGASTSWLEHHIQRSKDIVKLGAGACSGDKTGPRNIRLRLQPLEDSATCTTKRSRDQNSTRQIRPA